MTTRSHLHDAVLMPHLLVDGLNRYDDRPCFFLGETTASYSEVRARTSQFIQALKSRGLGVGASLAVLSGNRPEVLYNMAAGLIAGCATTPLHPMGSLDDQVYMLEDAGIETLIFDPGYFGARARELKERIPKLKLLSFGPFEGADDYSALASTFKPEPLIAPDVQADDINTIVYTGGTTGKPKGVIQPYRTGAYMTHVQMAEWDWPKDLRFLIATPLSHAAAAFFIPVLLEGGCLYAMAGFRPDHYFEMIEKHRITATFLVPVMLYALLDSPASKGADLSSLEVIYYGASPMSPARLKEGLERWGKIFFQFYGQSEAPMVLTHMKKEEHDLDKPERFASCGRPAPWVHLALLDDDGKAVAKGESGEICLRGPIVMAGYHNLPEATTEVFAGGWLHSGDVGRLDEDGFLYIVDRKKDMIVTGGFNVFPREIEDVISAHPSVAMVAVVGVPDERWGEAVKAVVVVKPGASAGDELVADLQERVKVAKGSVQSPKTIDIVDSIPLSAVGKPDKKVLKARYWGDQGRGVN